jgi:hypothetical protein
MGKYPIVVRRKNVFYFRVRIPAKHQISFDAREIVQSLRNENREEATHKALKLAANFKELLLDLKTGRADKACKTACKTFQGPG